MEFPRTFPYVFLVLILARSIIAFVPVLCINLLYKIVDKIK